MKVDLFDFDLPQTCIAQHPVHPRDAARMLVVGEKTLSDKGVTDLAAELEANDILVFNDTRVIPARLTGVRGEEPHAAQVEVTLHKRDNGRTWYAFARPAKKLKVGDTIHFDDGLLCEVIDKGDGGEVLLTFSRADNELMAALEKVGVMPLPPAKHTTGASPCVAASNTQSPLGPRTSTRDPSRSASFAHPENLPSGIRLITSSIASPSQETIE